MARAVEDPVYVRVHPPGTQAEASPEQFIWRDRIYVVQSVLSHWRERRSWWPGSTGRAPIELIKRGEGSKGDRSAVSSVAELAAAGDREIWRVQAGSGRRSAGVFELCAEGSDEQRLWRLLRVED